LEYLRSTKFADIKFEHIHPDKQHNWLNLAENDWEDFILLIDKENKIRKAIFDFAALGVSTNRDEWVYDFDFETLKQKAGFFVSEFNRQGNRLRQQDLSRIDELVENSIKWTGTLKRASIQGKELEFDPKYIIKLGYRPYVKVLYYSDKYLSDRLTSNHYKIFGNDLMQENIIIAVNESYKIFNIIANNIIVDLHFSGDTACLPLYRYARQAGVDNEPLAKEENITDWALGQFQKRYKDKIISKLDLFHYVYAVLHHPAYRAKYEQNLKREFPRLPFYDDFRQWAAWGEQLMELHLNYETVQAYPLAREEKAVPKDPLNPPVARLTARKEQGVIEVDTVTTLRGVPAEAWQYRLGTYSALGWVLERYKEKTPKDPTIREKFNTYKFTDYKEKVIDLLQKVCSVSVETMRIIEEMPK
jgi:predicted helicase